MLNNKSFNKIVLLSKFYEKNILQKKNLSAELLSDMSYKDIKEILDKQDMELLCFNKNPIHEILYISEQIININFETNNNLAKLFYLTSLIDDDENVINYDFNYNFIENIYFNQENSDNIFKKVSLCKIILDLIKNYRGIYNNEYKLDFIEKKSIENLKSFFNKLNLQFNLNNIKNQSIDEFYSEIILFYLNKLENALLISDIFDNLDLENIELTEKMYSKIIKNLNINYKIKQLDDLSNKNIINYYYILLKYIFNKNSIYLNNISFFSDSKVIIIKAIQEVKLNIENYDEEDKPKIEYIINSLADSKYYIDKFNNNNNIINDLIESNEIHVEQNYTIFPNISIKSINNKNNNQLPTEEYQNLENVLNYLEYNTRTSHLKKRKKSKKKKKYKNKINTFSKKISGIKKKKKEDKYDIINYMDKLYINDKDKNHILFEFIKYKYIYLEKINIYNNTYGYKINSSIIALIKDEYNKDELMYNIKEITEIKKFKIIIEIPNINKIINLYTNSKKRYNFITICKILFDDTNINNFIYNNDNSVSSNILQDSNNSNFENNYRIDSISNNYNNLFFYRNLGKEDCYNFINLKFEIEYIYPIFDVLENEIVLQTNYFFVLCTEDGTQIIKLYRINYEGIIKYANDIIVDEIKEKIHSIKQLVTGRIVISCLNGIHYIYSCPNLIKEKFYEECESQNDIWDMLI